MKKSLFALKSRSFQKILKVNPNQYMIVPIDYAGKEHTVSSVYEQEIYF